MGKFVRWTEKEKGEQKKVEVQWRKEQGGEPLLQISDSDQVQLAVKKAPPGEPAGFVRVPREVCFFHGETLRKEARKSWEPVYRKGVDEVGQPRMFRTRLGDASFNYLSHEQAALVQKEPGAASQASGTQGNSGLIANSRRVGTWIIDPEGEDNKPRTVYSEGGVFYVVLNVNTKRVLSKDEADRIVFADSIDRYDRPRNLESFAKTFPQDDFAILSA